MFIKHCPLISPWSSTTSCLTSSSSTCGQRGKHPHRPKEANKQPKKLHTQDRISHSDIQAPPNWVQQPGYGFWFPNLVPSLSQKPKNAIQSSDLTITPGDGGFQPHNSTFPLPLYSAPWRCVRRGWTSQEQPGRMWRHSRDLKLWLL